MLLGKLRTGSLCAVFLEAYPFAKITRAARSGKALPLQRVERSRAPGRKRERLPRSRVTRRHRRAPRPQFSSELFSSMQRLLEPFPAVENIVCVEHPGVKGSAWPASAVLFLCIFLTCL